MILRSRNLATLLVVWALFAILSLFLFGGADIHAQTRDSCPEGQTWSLNRCTDMAEATCQTGYTYVADNGCVHIPLEVSACPNGYTMEGGRCQLEGQACPVGQDWRDGSCQYRDEQSCPAGKERIDGSCVHIIDTICPVGYRWNDVQTRCQDNNENDNDSGNDNDNDNNNAIVVSPGLSFSNVLLYVVEGGTGTYTVVLTTRPPTNVTVTINDPANTDLTTEPEILTFTPDTWNIPQVVTVTTIEDSDEEDDEATITHTISGDDTYDSLPDPDVTVTVIDNDRSPGFTISETSLTVTEGDDVTYTVVLDAAPTADVTVTINDPTNTDVTTRPDSLTFTSENWYLPKTVTVSSKEDDDELHDEATVTHTVSGTDNYSAITAPDVLVTVHDDDGNPGITISESSVTVGEGDDVTYTIVLDAQPTADVTVTINDPTDNTDVTTYPATVTFTFSFWDQPQTVTVSAAPDTDELHEAATVTHTVSGTAEYTSVTADDVDVIVHDDDGTPGVTVSTAFLTVPEDGSNTYTIVLDAQPTAAVFVVINDPTTTGTDVTAEPGSLGFNLGNWDDPQTVTVSADADDDQEHDSETVTHSIHSVSADEYVSVTVASVVVTVIDDDIPELNSQVEGGGDLTGSTTTTSTSVELDVSFSRPYTVYTYGESKWHSLQGAKETKVEAYWKLDGTGTESTTVDSQTLWTNPDSEDSFCINTTPDATKRTYEFAETVELPAEPTTTEIGSWQLRLRVQFDGVDAGDCNASIPTVPAADVAGSTWTHDLN